MSGIINLLPDSLANQIAAGEVIQRPASVVKELLENALDAGADKIKLILKDSGKTLIQVVDNGIGMNEVDARMCFERHATSKIKKSDDLFNINSFGFRGEAMASIAAVSTVYLKSKHKDHDLGTEILIEGSKVKSQTPCNTALGTSIAVRNLFFNVPARRKFLKSDPVELKHILEEFIRVALPHPQVHFSVHHNENELYHFPKSNLRQRIVNYFSKGVNEKIVPVTEETDFVTISGFVGKPDLIKKTRGDQYLFVNHRFIKSNYLNHAIKMAFDSLIPKDHHPFYVMMLTIDPAFIDVNIHPTKQEIKFENERLIYNYVRVAVKHALGKYSVVPALDFDAVNVQQFDRTQREPEVAHRPSYQNDISYKSGSRATSQQEKDQWTQFYTEISSVDTSIPVEPKSMTLHSDWSDEQEKDIASDQPSSNSFQVHDAYLISSIKSGLLVIDQEAAHERILYERYLSRLQNTKMASQKSLFPETVQVDHAYVSIIDELIPQLKYLGFGVDKVSSQTYIINSIPVDGLNESAASYINRFLTTYAANQELELDMVDNIARSMAFNSGIKKGKKLEQEEIDELIDQLFGCQLPYSSPSGKKCFITYSLDEMLQQFKS